MASPRFTSPNTPESLLPRSDSKNPARTCQGITTTGRKCRRDVGLTGSPSPTGNRRASAPAAPSDSTAMYCWQHKHQVPAASPVTNPAQPIRPIKERASEDTLLGRLGNLSLEDTVKQRPSKKPHPKPKPKKSTWSMLCCMTAHDASDDEGMEVVVRKRRPRPEMSQRPPPTKAHSDTLLTTIPSHTGTLLSLIPRSTSPQTTSALLAELAKPLSPLDEAGYIYIFVLTDGGAPAPSESTTTSLLTPAADGVARALSTTQRRPNSDGRGRLLLKIGRAVNVHRRMEQWQRQCGFNLSLVRFYPYVSSRTLSPQTSSSPSPTPRRSSTPHDVSRGMRQVPYSHRVERLVHLELSGLRAKLRACEACGREHREWFCVEASRAGVGFVDSVVRRWVGWAEGVGKA